MAIEGFIYGYVLEEETYTHKSTIIEEGSKGDWLYVVLEGKVKIKKQTPKGMVTIETVGEGGIIGEAAMLKKTDNLRTASVMAEGNVVMGLLDRDRLEKEYQLLSPQLRNLIRVLIQRMENAARKASALVAG